MAESATVQGTVRGPGAGRMATRRLAGIEGVRAIAALSIVVYHGWLYGAPYGRPVPLGAPWASLMPHLALGVTVFFTLSGFLLYRPFAAALLGNTGRPSIRAYLRNRALRILPAYWVVLILVAVVLGGAILPNTAPGLRIGSLAGDPADLLVALGFVQNYAPTTLYLGIGPAWSLSVEVVFYLALPVLAALAWAVGRTAGRRRMASLGPPLVLLALGLSGKLVAATIASPSPTGGGDVSWRDVATVTFFAQADLFAPGMLLAVVHSELVERRRTMGLIAQLGLVGLAILVGVPAVALSSGDGLSPYAYQTLAAVSAALLLAVVVLPTGNRAPARWLVRLLETRALFATGVISYSLFLWHEPVIHLLERQGLTTGDAFGLARNVLVIALVTVPLAALTYHVVERPALKRKAARGRVVAPDPSGLGRAGSAVPADQGEAAMPADQTEAAP